MDAIAETNATYLQNAHWQSQSAPSDIPIAPALSEEPQFTLSDFTVAELDWAIRSLKRNKAPGPD
eukprot:1955387-Prorocentrum_lima.AAC.1